MALKYPEDLLYSKEHEWVRKEPNGTVTVGITDFAQSQLGDIVFVELPNIGDEFEADERFGTVEAVKTVSELYMPVSGTVIEVNTAILDDPSMVNNEPYDNGWLIKVNPKHTSEFDHLLPVHVYTGLTED